MQITVFDKNVNLTENKNLSCYNAVTIYLTLMNKKPLTSKRERTRLSIIQAALSIIADQGLPGTSIDELMSRTGMARGTFYNYFQTRDQLLNEVIEEVRDQFHQAVIEKIPEDIPSEATAACSIYGIIRYCMAYPDFGWALVRLSTDVDFFQPPSEDDHRFQRTNQALMTGFQRDIPFIVAQIYTIGSVDSLIRHLLQGRINIQQAEAMMVLILRGLGTEEDQVDGIIAIARDFADQLAKNFQKTL